MDTNTPKNISLEDDNKRLRKIIESQDIKMDELHRKVNRLTRKIRRERI